MMFLIFLPMNRQLYQFSFNSNQVIINEYHAKAQSCFHFAISIADFHRDDFGKASVRISGSF